LPEKRIVLRNSGQINPDDINTYIARDGFKALTKAMETMTPEQVIEELKSSGLRGRGGAGFPIGMKLEMAKLATGAEKYVICNADEGEVGTFKDRVILQNDPFNLFEGIAIASYAIGARQAFLYVRAEYHYLFNMLQKALEQVNNKGFLSHVTITLREGAGAYVCGEESALMESIEGKRGEVRYRPPFPTNAGLWQQPTTINNVETISNLPPIILNGASWFSKIGTERSKGTKVLSVAGDVEKPGVYEIELGTPLSEVVIAIGKAENVKAIQIGGATGRLVPASNINTPLSFETVLGAGAITVFNTSRDMVEMIYHSAEFLAEESCGKCFPCREGTKNILAILSRFLKNEGKQSDLSLLDQLARTMMLSSSCGLGQAAPNVVLDGLQYFKEEFLNRIKTPVPVN
jgi:NADH:ubiquinone oxidoreductase subunit F (NADH-binding)